MKIERNIIGIISILLIFSRGLFKIFTSIMILYLLGLYVEKLPYGLNTIAGIGSIAWILSDYKYFKSYEMKKYEPNKNMQEVLKWN